MVLPALFVAAEAARRAGGAYDVHILAESGELQDEHVRWMAAHGIQRIAGLDFARLRRIAIADKRLTAATLIRLLMPEILAGRYDRVLYLDADVEICGDIAPLFGLDLGGAPLAAVPLVRASDGGAPGFDRGNEARFRALGMTRPYRYFNSGVMLIDTQRWIAQDLGERLLDFIERNTELCKLPDEDALNAVLDGGIAEISPIWNFRSWERTLPRIRKRVAPVILHYDGPEKPWRRFSARRRLFSLEGPYRRYRRFAAGTPWLGWLERQWSVRDLRDNVRFELTVLANRLRGKGTRGVRAAAVARKQRKKYCHRLRQMPFADVAQGIAVFRDGKLMPNTAAHGIR
jgi:lipopolysaccharide biosynthesis glycosyltransferase